MMTKQSVGLIAVASMLSLGIAPLPARAAVDDTPGQGQSDKNKKATPAAKGDKADKGNQPRAKDASVVVVIDRDGHHRVVREYITRGTLPPGLAKRDALPPGLSTQLREKGRLPPGLEIHFTPVPASMIGRFPAIPVYYTRYFVGRDLIIIDTRSDLIVSLIRDILR